MWNLAEDYETSTRKHIGKGALYNSQILEKTSKEQNVHSNILTTANH